MPKKKRVLGEINSSIVIPISFARSVRIDLVLNPMSKERIRIPKNNTSISLAKKNPIITTSANINGENIAKDLNEAKKIFGNSCIYLDGEKPNGVESTIIDLTNDTPKIVRIGALYGNTLENILGH